MKSVPSSRVARAQGRAGAPPPPGATRVSSWRASRGWRRAGELVLRVADAIHLLAGKGPRTVHRRRLQRDAVLVHDQVPAKAAWLTELLELRVLLTRIEPEAEGARVAVAALAGACGAHHRVRDDRVVGEAELFELVLGLARRVHIGEQRLRSGDEGDDLAAPAHTKDRLGIGEPHPRRPPEPPLLRVLPAQVVEGDVHGVPVGGVVHLDVAAG